jgi:DNA-binding XRE family transcriptional regulator
MSILSERIQQERNWVRYTPGMVAKHLGISREEYTAFEQGDTEPTDNQLTNLACLFGTTPDRLRGECLRADPRVERLLAAKNITAEDAYEVHRFAEYLRYAPR